MFAIGIICLFALVTCNDYEENGVEYDEEYDDYSPTQDESGSGSGDGDDTTTTSAPSKNVDDKGSGGGGAIVGGILGGLCVFAGLAVLGRRFCKSSTGLNKKEKEKHDKDLDYDYYGIIQRRTSSSYA
jgi:hypothetical protein